MRPYLALGFYSLPRAFENAALDFLASTMRPRGATTILRTRHEIWRVSNERLEQGTERVHRNTSQRGNKKCMPMRKKFHKKKFRGIALLYCTVYFTC